MSDYPVLKRPLLLLAVITVCMTYAIMSFPFGISATVAVLCGVCGIILVFVAVKSRRILPALAAFVCFVAVYATLCRYTTEIPAVKFLDVNEGREMEFYGKIVHKQNGDNYANYTLSLEKPLKAKAKLLTFGTEFSHEGDYISGTAKIIRPEKTTSRNFEEELNLKADGIFIKLEGSSNHETGKKSGLSQADRVRQSLDTSLVRFTGSASGIGTYGIAKGLILGDKTYIPDEVYRDFRRSGIMHILTVSGLHLSVISAFVAWLLALIGFPKSARNIAIILLCAGFAALNDFTLPVVRSAVMACMLCLGNMFSRKRDSLTSIAAAAIVVIIISPYSVFDVGACLSFLAATGIVMSANVVKVIESGAYHVKGKAIRVIRKITAYIAGALVISASASAFTLPVTVASFGEVSVVSMLTNLVTGPLVTVILILCVVICTLSFVPMQLCTIVCTACGIAVKLLCRLLCSIAKWFSQLSWSCVTVEENTALCVILGIFVAAVIAAAVFANKKRICYLSLTIIVLMCLCCTAFVLSFAKEQSLDCINVNYDSNGAYLSVRCADGGQVSYAYVSAGAKNTLHFSAYTDICDEIHGNNTYIVAPRGDLNPILEHRCITSFSQKYGIEKLLVPMPDKDTQYLSEQYRKLALMLEEDGIAFEYYRDFIIEYGDFVLCFTPDRDGFNVLVCNKRENRDLVPSLIMFNTDRYSSQTASHINTAPLDIGGLSSRDAANGILSDTRIPLFVYSKKRKAADLEGIITRPNVYVMNVNTDYGITMEKNIPVRVYTDGE